MSGTSKQARSKIRWGIAGILVLLFITILFDAPSFFNNQIKSINNATGIGIPTIPEKGFALGLDLKGGAHLVYKADVSAIAFGERGSALDGVKDVIERRVNALGVGEPSVQTSQVGDEYRIIVELAGVYDVQLAKEKIGETPILEFKKQNTAPARDLNEEEQKQMDDYNKDAEKRAGEISKQLNEGGDFTKLAGEKSEDEASKVNGGYIGYLGNIPAYSALYEWASKAKEGDITKEPILSQGGYYLLKRGQEKDGDQEISASHILICYLGAKKCDGAIYTKTEALKKAQEIYEQANSENFADLAKQYSSDPGSKDIGGDLGWFGRNAMVKPFEDAVFGANPNEIVGPVETEFGFHIIYKKEIRYSKVYEIWGIMTKTKSPYDILPPQDPWTNTGLSGKQLDRAEVVTDQRTGATQVSLQFDQEGKDLFSSLTKENVGKPIAIFLDGEPISVPVVNESILDGKAVISGNFSILDAQLLTQRLNAGALPVPIEIVSQQTVGATLGAESLSLSQKAAMFAIVLVMLFMVLYYRLPGVISVISLTLYIALTLTLFKILNVTLTLAGIAGFVLSVGMAVDANVLIFERMKEELRSGKSLKLSIEEGFSRAWSSIRDGNLSTLLTCFLLIFLGSSFVKGFAITLTVGILVSMFSAITVTRVVLRFVAPWFGREGNSMFLGFKKDSQN